MVDPQILIVDDDAEHAASVRHLLAAHDYPAAIETDGRQAVARLCAGEFHVAILDLNMPGTSGFDVLEALGEQQAPVKSIVLSGESSVATVTPILRLGAHDYLTKPFEPQQLLTSLGNALDLFRLETQNRTLAAKADADHELHQFLVNASDDLIYMLDADGNFRFLNQRLPAIFDMQPEALLGQPWGVLLGADLEQTLAFRFNERRTGARATRNYEFDFVAAGGDARIFEFSATGLYEDDDPQRPAGTYGVLRDVTDAQRIARQLEQSQRKFYGLFMDSPDAVFITRLSDGELLEGNDNFRHIKWKLGATDATTDAFIFRNVEARTALVEQLDRSPNHASLTVEHPLHGVTQYFEINARVLELDGEACVLNTMRDRTQERRAEVDRLSLQNQLQQASKMEAIGQLAGGIAHDFNNILASIIGYAELVQTARQRLEAKQVDGYLEEVVTAGHRARDLISQMLTFTRASRGDPCPVDVPETIADVARMLRAAIPTTIDIHTEYGDDLADVFADPVKLQQVVMNLLINARDAIEGNGTISVAVRRATQDHECAACSERLSGEHIVLSVTDTGHGIPDTIRDKVFEMYFTTRESGKGTGMGLWLINNLIHEYGGHITLDSEVGVGTTFRVHLPISDGATAAPEPVRRTTGDIRGKIVVVDDEVSVGNFIGEVLRDHDLDAVIFNESPTAYRYLQSHADEVALLITDQAMPLLSGLDLAEHIKDARSDLPIILITAFTQSRDSVRMERIGIDRFLAKPFSIDELLDTIYELAPQGDAAVAQ